MYIDAVNTLNPNQPVSQFTFIVIEKTEPFNAITMVLEDIAIEMGRLRYKKALQQIKKLGNPTERGWQMPTKINLPDWYYREYGG